MRTAEGLGEASVVVMSALAVAAGIDWADEGRCSEFLVYHPK